MAGNRLGSPGFQGKHLSTQLGGGRPGTRNGIPSTAYHLPVRG